MKFITTFIRQLEDGMKLKIENATKYRQKIENATKYRQKKNVKISFVCGCECVSVCWSGCMCVRVYACL